MCVHSFNGLFSTTTWVSQHQKGKPFWILLEQEMMEWQWQQLDNMQIVCTSLQTDNHASTSPFSFYRPDALLAAQPTASKHWRFTWKMVVKTLCFHCTADVLDTKTRYVICQRCIQCFGDLADSDSGIQAGILRLLLESTLSKVTFYRLC